MESENRLTMEEEIIVSEKADVEESAAEEKKVEPTACINGERASNLKEDSKQQGTKSKGKASKDPANVSKIRISKTFKKPGHLSGGNAKNIKVTKDKPNMRSPTQVTRNRRHVLSQSHSFPVRRVHGDAIVKSIDGYKEKLIPNMEKSSKVHGSSSNGSNPSLSGLSHPNRRGCVHVDSKNVNGGGATSRRTTLASLPSNKQLFFFLHSFFILHQFAGNHF